MDHSGEISALKAKALKVRFYAGSFKYKRGDGATRHSLLRGSAMIMLTYEKDTDNELWEKDIKEALDFSFATLRDKLTLYIRIPLWVFSP